MTNTAGLPEDDQTPPAESGAQGEHAPGEVAGAPGPAAADPPAASEEGGAGPDRGGDTAPASAAPDGTAASAPAAPCDTPSNAQPHAEQVLHGRTHEHLRKLQDTLEALNKQVSFLPPQLRMFGAKIDGLATTISEPRYRAVLAGLVSILDMVDQMRRSARIGPDEPTDHLRNYDVLYTQLRQLLEGNGLREIPTDGAFDPRYHRAVERVESSVPTDADRILDVVRPGFQTEQTVLRYAEVKVGYHPQSRP